MEALRLATNARNSSSFASSMGGGAYSSNIAFQRSKARCAVSLEPSSSHFSQDSLSDIYCIIIGGFVICHGMGRSQEMACRCHIVIGRPAQGVVIHVKTSKQFLISAEPVSIDNQFFKTGYQAAFEPAGRMEGEIGPAQCSRVHGIGALGRSLGICDLGRCQRAAASQGQIGAVVPTGRSHNSTVTGSGMPKVGAPDFSDIEERKLPNTNGEPGRTSWPNAPHISASASAWAMDAAVVTGPIAAAQYEGQQPHTLIGRRIGPDCLGHHPVNQKGELVLTLPMMTQLFSMKASAMENTGHCDGILGPVHGGYGPQVRFV